MGTMYVLGRRGDTEGTWDPADPNSVAKARKEFERYKADRCLAFSTPDIGGDASLIREFDPQAEEIIVSRPLVGG